MRLNYNEEVNTSRLTVTGYVILFLLCSFFTYRLLAIQPAWIFLDNVNLFVHEAGHLLFAFLGNFIMLLGGTIAQLALPGAFLIYFFIRKNYFSVLFCLFWLGDNFVNVSIYVKDAETMALPLVGGGEHDWNLILTQLDLLSQTQLLGSVVYFFGFITIIASLLLMLFHIIISLTKLNASAVP